MQSQVKPGLHANFAVKHHFGVCLLPHVLMLQILTHSLSSSYAPQQTGLCVFVVVVVVFLVVVVFGHLVVVFRLHFVGVFALWQLSESDDVSELLELSELLSDDDESLDEHFSSR